MDSYSFHNHLIYPNGILETNRKVMDKKSKSYRKTIRDTDNGSDENEETEETETDTSEDEE